MNNSGFVTGLGSLGGLVGYNLGTVLPNNFWNMDLLDSSIINPENDTSVSALDYSTIQMKMASYFDNFDLKKFLDNDYDIETLQKNLVM